MSVGFSQRQPTEHTLVVRERASIMFMYFNQYLACWNDVWELEPSFRPSLTNSTIHFVSALLSRNITSWFTYLLRPAVEMWLWRYKRRDCMKPSRASSREIRLQPQSSRVSPGLLVCLSAIVLKNYWWIFVKPLAELSSEQETTEWIFDVMRLFVCVLALSAALPGIKACH